MAVRLAHREHRAPVGTQVLPVHLEKAWQRQSEARAKVGGGQGQRRVRGRVRAYVTPTMAYCHAIHIGSNCEDKALHRVRGTVTGADGRERIKKQYPVRHIPHEENTQ